MPNNADLDQYNEVDLSGVFGNEVSAKLVIPLVKRLLAGNSHIEPDGKPYFADESITALRAVNGIVETPRLIAEYMVTLAYSRWKQGSPDAKDHYRSVHWFDPCGGAGVFPLAILKFHLGKLTSASVSRLPRITIYEISKLGLAVSLVNIIKFLLCSGVSPSDYFSSGKLRLVLGDTLSEFQEAEDLYSKTEKIDIVIGNPPYVRATMLETSYKNTLKKAFPGMYCGIADLYTYFIASGISSLNAGGVLSFISPAAFLRAKSGAQLRDWLLKSASLDSFVDLDETKIFENADLHSAIYVFRKNRHSTGTVQYRHTRNKSELDSLIEEKVPLKTVSISTPPGAGWSFHESQTSLEKYLATFTGCVKLQDLGVKVYSGIRSGYSEAFILDAKQYHSFAPEIRNKWIKPTILPSNILKWSGNKEVSYLIVIPAGSSSVQPELITHLSLYRDELTKRKEVKDRDEWYALRSCSYYNEMENRKIVFPDLSAQQRFSLVEEGFAVVDGSFFIDSDSLVLLGVLNSTVAKSYFVHRCSSVGNLNSSGRFRFKKEFVKDFPLPRNCLSDGPLQTKIAELVLSMIRHGETEETNLVLDELVEKLYGDRK